MNIFNRFKQTSEVETNDTSNYTYSLDLLNEHNDEYYDKINKKIYKNNERIMKDIKSLININLLIAYDSDRFHFISEQIGDNYFELTYSIEDRHVKDKIKELQEDLNDCMLNQYTVYIEDHYNFLNNQHFLKFMVSYDNDQFSFINTKDIFKRGLKSIIEPKFECIVGITNDNEPFIVNLSQKSNMIISGRTGCGKSNVAKQVLLSLIAQYSNSELDLKIFDETKVDFDEFRLSKYVSEYINGIDEMEILLNNLNNEVQRRLELFNKTGLTHIVKYNLQQIKQDEPVMKRIVIYIDECMNLSDNAINMINSISKIGNDLGIHFIVVSQNISYNTANLVKLFDDNVWHYILFKGFHHHKFKGEYDQLFKTLRPHEFIYYEALGPYSSVMRRCRGCNISNEVLSNVMTELSLK